jgi:NADH dehydrogenase
MGPQVVIVGGGFGGLNAALAMAKLPVEVTVVDRRNFHLFQPLLYQVATGGLSPGDITAPLRHVLRHQKNTRVLLAEVTDFDPAHREVILQNGRLAYDYLILATGAANHYFGHGEWPAHAPGLKTIEDATEIRRRIFTAFEQAEQEQDPERRRSWLRFVVVGAGPTGVEMAGAISEIARDTLRGNFRLIQPEEAEILLLEGASRVLPAFPEDLSLKAERSLIGLGVRPRTGVRVNAIDPAGVSFAGPHGAQRIESRTVIWAAGVRPSPLGTKLAAALGAAVDREGRVAVGPDLSVPGHPEILVIGDLARCEENGRPLPGLCPVAMQQGRHVAETVRARLEHRQARPFRYWDKGTMATIGRAKAVVDLGRLHFGGWFAWLTWLFVHLLYLVSFQNRVVVAIQWAFQYLTFNRGARLITGEPPPPPPP